MPKNSFADWDTTASNNTDIAGIDIQGTAAVQNFDNALRTLMAQLKSGASGLTLDNTFSGANTFSGINTFSKIVKWAKGADVASATALTLGTDGNYFDITGTTSITSITTIGAGTVVKLHFDGILTLTHHATDLILPGGANITTAAGDEAEFVEYATGDWRCVSYQRSTYVPPVITPWVAYTPTLVGFGTATGVTFYSRRVGSNLEIFARFAAGTSTATEARIPIGFNGTEANVAVSSLMNSAVWTVGIGGINITAASQYFLIALGGATYLRIGLQSSGRPALTAVDGNVALPSSGNTLAFTASVPIEGWQ